ncbi:MAG: hypothetical protein HKN30_17315 [Sulfitobacter sp.]|nr:hypothetical protein [Sulfitobacter sp.]
MTSATGASAEQDQRWYLDRFAGIMSENRWHEVFDPSRAKFADSGLLGVGLGWERQIGKSRFHFGVQGQAVVHFGRQDHFEFNVPVILRYVPRNPVPRWLKSASFGLGLSYATKVPQVEVDRTGESQRTFAYWLTELEFDTALPDSSLFVRLHHRSDAFGAFEADSGSTAVSFGWRTER